ncbi:prolyl oligopeptidase family serine peptidase [Curtobacterium sp. MCBD17_003]|uniref:S9 family peptidase n=1 Tax=Curtobacterium sp. MCBD17_003 TaxID=2175667 RepID=UPI000DA76995|nr:prolyl oligopeptidase family serine peptidase [Curtobacterium sp. MCBD17_003]WIE55760.1 prolyl oligopeptidase family serine peptidase [Curtobacterium sp. MCBD17_003]
MPNDDDATPFSDLDAFVALPRVDGIALSPDGTRVALTVSTLDHDRTGYTRSIWSVPTSGEGVPVRLTRSAKGEGGVAFTRNGDVLFVSARPDADAAKDTEAGQVWLLPAAGGEARAVTRLAGGAGIAATAREADTVVISAGLLPGANDAEGRLLERDAELRAARKEHAVAAILHETHPVRFWDHDLGPDEPHLLALDLGDLHETLDAPVAPGTAAPDEVAVADAPVAVTAEYPAELPRPRDLTPFPGRSADTAGQALTPDGRTLVAALTVHEQRGVRAVLVAIDTETGERTTLFDEPDVFHEMPAVSHDGTTIAWVRAPRDTPAGPADREIWVADLDGGHARRIATEWDRWANEFVFDADDRALIATADQDGRAPVFRIPLDGSAVEQRTTDEHAYSGVAVDRATGVVVALRSSWAGPLHPVRIDPDGTVTALPTPAPLPAVPGRVEEVETTTADGTRVRGWLVLPTGASADAPAPFLLWIHGGPLSSWNAWSWRWSPMVAAARGYAVLLPDPALSTGYGLEFIARGWNAWGQAPYTDLLAITDAVVARPDVDETRTAAMGGSFGGYMANWVAGHTDRFDAIVTHASLWALDQFAGTTDASYYWQSIFTAEGMAENDPHRSVEAITTPMLVIHGDKDYRVPIGEGLRLWSELAEHHADPDGTMPHRFLYFPNENHWILTPQHAKVWYETVFAFLAQHVLGEAWERPELLG